MVDVSDDSIDEKVKEPPPYSEYEISVIDANFAALKERMKVPGYEQTLEDQQIRIRYCRAHRETAFHLVQASSKTKKEKKEKVEKEPSESKPRKKREKKLTEDEIAKKRQEDILKELGF